VQARAAWRVVLVVSSLALIGALVFVGPSVAQSQQEQVPDPRQAGAERQLGEAREAQQRRAARRATAEVEQERRRSRTAYRGLGREEALALARERFSRFVDQPVWRPLRLREGERVDEYLGQFSARVQVADDRQALVQSMLPLRSQVGSGEPEPVSLQLQQQAEALVPANPLVSTRIAEKLDGGVSFGSGIALRLLSEAATSAQVVEDKAFFANAARTWMSWWCPLRRVRRSPSRSVRPRAPSRSRLAWTCPRAHSCVPSTTMSRGRWPCSAGTSAWR